MPIKAVEPLFNALNILRPTNLTKLEYRAIQSFKDQILMELELYMESPDEKEERQMKFYQLFNEMREKKRRINQEVEANNV